MPDKLFNFMFIGMKKFCTEKFCPEMVGKLSSWSWIASDLAEEFNELSNSGNLTRNGKYPVIWETRQKFVLKIPSCSCGNIVYKTYDNFKSVRRYFLRYSPCGKEAVNYQMLANIGIPLPKLLGVGDGRKSLQLKSSFFISEFAEGFRDGRDFYTDGCLCDALDTRHEFISGHLQLLARCHDHNIFHRGFTPANLMYKFKAAPDEQGNTIDLLWIDLASCRKVFSRQMPGSIVFDIAFLLRFFDLSEQETDELLTDYFHAAQCRRLSWDKLRSKVQTELARWAAKGR